MDELTVAGRRIGPEQPPYVIAEIGANHNGDMELCRRLIDAAQACGADAVKFQSWTKDSLISRAEYARNTRYAADQRVPTLEQAVERYQLTPAHHQGIAEHCRAPGRGLLLELLLAGGGGTARAPGCSGLQMASMDVNHLPLLECVAQTGKPVLLSTGMATLGEVERALSTLRADGAGPIALLHCVSIYPCPPELVNLRMLETWRARVRRSGWLQRPHAGYRSAAGGGRAGCLHHREALHPRPRPGGLGSRNLSRSGRAAGLVRGRARRPPPPWERAPERLARPSSRSARPSVAGWSPRRAMTARRAAFPDDIDFKRRARASSPTSCATSWGAVLTRDVVAEEELEWADLA